MTLLSITLHGGRKAGDTQGDDNELTRSQLSALDPVGENHNYTNCTPQSCNKRLGSPKDQRAESWSESVSNCCLPSLRWFFGSWRHCKKGNCDSCAALLGSGWYWHCWFKRFLRVGTAFIGMQIIEDSWPQLLSIYISSQCYAFSMKIFISVYSPLISFSAVSLAPTCLFFIVWLLAYLTRRAGARHKQDFAIA